MGELIQGFLPDSEFEFTSWVGKALKVLSVALLLIVGGLAGIAELAGIVYLVITVVTGGSVGSWGGAISLFLLLLFAPFLFAVAFSLLAVLFAFLGYPFEIGSIRQRRVEEAPSVAPSGGSASGDEEEEYFDPDDPSSVFEPWDDDEDRELSRFCGQCGRQFSVQERFCPNCGATRSALSV